MPRNWRRSPDSHARSNARAPSGARHLILFAVFLQDRVEDGQEGFGLLRAAQRVSSVDDEAGHAPDAETAGEFILRTHVFLILVTIQIGSGRIPVQTAFLRDIQKRLGIADILTVQEIAFEKRAYDVFPAIMFGTAGKADKTMGQHGVLRI